MADLFDVKVICPERIFYEGKAAMLELNTSEGEVGIYKKHVPTTMIIAPGIMTITEENGEKKAAVHAGFIEILEDRVTVLAEIAEWPGEIDVNRALAAKARAEGRLRDKKPDTNYARAETALHRAIARINVVK